MIMQRGWVSLARGALAALALGLLSAAAHTIPISYLRLVADDQYIHLELLLNPFELTFFSEVDDNKDGELDPAELKAHGEQIAKRVVGTLKIKIGHKLIAPENAGMDPDMSGHHVRVRAHYKVNARQLPLTIESDFNSITSASHVMQVTYVVEGKNQLAQLDMQSKKAVFEVPASNPARKDIK
jgi:hypothetical protein